MLNQAGYGVTFATSGKQAFDRIQNVKPDLILLDIMMPEMDGYEVCHRLKANPDTRTIPVIFLSALDEEWDQVKAFRIGGMDYITKPFQTEVVLARIQHQLQIQNLQRELQNRNGELETKNQQLLKEIEDRKRAEEQALRASQAKTDFLNRMSHELRTPLNTVLGYVELILLKPTRSVAQNQGYLQAIQSSGEHLLAMINDVLSMGKIETGRITLTETTVDLHQLLQDLDTMFKLQALEKGLTFQVDRGANLPQWIKSDPVKLRQVFINLISNALKFTSEGRIVIRGQVEAIQKATSNGSTYTLSFTIEDTGSGIAADEIDKVFQPFEQTQTGRDLKKGTGLGMAISREFIRLMGGDISVTSTVGQGTCFQFEIQTVGMKPSSTITADSSPSNFLPDANRSAYRILVVDETKVNRDLFVKMLIYAGYEVKEAGNGEEAIALWSTWQPHLILMDLYMPIMSGYEAAQEIRAQESSENQTKPQTKIIALTATTDQSDHLKAKEAGCDDVFLKPFKLKELLETIATHLQEP
jgi:signal transduction histidine kinase